MDDFIERQSSMNGTCFISGGMSQESTKDKRANF